MLWYDEGGAGDRTILLLHGLGATSAVWAGVEQALDQRRLGRWIAPDLSGHGQSDALSHYSVGELAAGLIPLIQGKTDLLIIGHSLGVYVGLALASRWFGIQVSGLVGLGPKIAWPEADLEATRELAARPVRWYPTSEEAWNRYRRVSGLDSATAPEETWLHRGINHSEQGWRLSQDPRTFGVAGAPFASLAASSLAPVVLARGQHDPMVSLAELHQYCQDARDIAMAGHNAHVQQPGEIVGLLERVLHR